MPKRDKTTTEGGSRGYRQVQSKWYKNSNGKPARVTAAREEMMDKLGRALKEDEIVHHVTPGSHHGKEQGKLAVTTRGNNTGESNKLRKDGMLYKRLKIKRGSN